MEPVQQYRRNREAYSEIEMALDQVNETFINSERPYQLALLKDATTYAVMSVQNSIEMLNRGFTAYARAESWSAKREGFKTLNYGNQKYDYVRHNHDAINGVFGDEVIDLLENEQVWDAVERMSDVLLGVQFIKASFGPAMLGFKKVMCTDTNVAQLVDGVEGSGYTDRDDYRDAVDAVLNAYPELSDELPPFMVQWVLFDANRRDGVAYHPEWFDHVLPGTPFGRQTSVGAFHKS